MGTWLEGEEKESLVNCLIALIGHLERANVRAVAKRFLSMLKREGLTAELLDIASDRAKKKTFDLVCVVGGDGSLLRIVREIRQRTPVLGIAAGKRSFLMQVKPKYLGKAAKAIAGGEFAVEERARLLGNAGKKRLPLALNELLFVPKESGLLIEWIITVGKNRKIIPADGLIVATPTGSTGHAFSAGGRKLKEDCGKLIVVPSNPLNRQWKAFAVSDKERIVVECLDKEKEIEVVVDGRTRFALKGKLSIERGEPALLLKVKGLQ